MMEKSESKKGMGCWAILTISVGMFIFGGIYILLYLLKLKLIILVG